MTNIIYTDTDKIGQGADGNGGFFQLKGANLHDSSYIISKTSIYYKKKNAHI